MQNSLSFYEKNVSSTRKRMYCNFTMEDLPKQKNHYRKIEYLPKFFIFLGIDEYNCIIFLDTETDQHIRHIDELKKFIPAVYSPPSLSSRGTHNILSSNFFGHRQPPSSMSSPPATGPPPCLHPEPSSTHHNRPSTPPPARGHRPLTPPP
jgi:hypothetical protein